MVHKAEHNAHGRKPRFVVTNLTAPSAAAIDDERYGPRGEAENRIQEHQLDRFGTRA